MGKFLPLHLFVLVYILSLFAGCKGGEVMVPGYVYIKPAVFTTKADGTQGAASAQISDYWVFEGGKLLGNYASPCLIPVQKTGAVSLQVEPGVKHSGMNEERVIYPMISTYTSTRQLKPGVVDTVQPTMSYLPNTVFKFMEDFDANGFGFIYNPNYKLAGDTVLRVSGSEAWDPAHFSGEVVLSQATSILEFYTPVFSGLPRGQQIYLELDYKTNIPFSVGLYINTPDGNVKQYAVYGIVEKSTWNKMYCDFQDDISTYPVGTTFRIFFRFANPLDVPVAEPRTWLDNIKFVYLD